MGEELIVQSIVLSFKVAVIAVINVAFIGILLARVMARHEFPGKTLLDSILTIPIVLPPSVVGFGLLILLGKHGPIGQLCEKLGFQPVLFTSKAAVIAATVVAFPLLYQSVKAAFESVDVRYEEVARTLGAGELRVFFTITLPLAWPGIVAGVVMSFARALGEFGATLMVAGNIPGVTQTIPLSIFFAVESADYQSAWLLVAIISVASVLMITWLNYWSKHRMSRWQQERKEVNA